MVIEVMPEVLLSLLTINRYEINLVVKEGRFPLHNMRKEVKDETTQVMEEKCVIYIL